MTVPTPTQTQIQVALVGFLTAILPSGVPVVAGQVNKVPEPDEDDFCILWLLRRERIETNVDSTADVKFTGAIAGATLTVSSVARGSISPGATLFGVGVASNTVIQTQTGGTPGGMGTYTVSPTQTVASETLSSGATNATQNTQIVYQIDVHGPNSSDNAQVISTLFRDPWGVDWFNAYAVANGVNVCPLFADDPRQVPFINAENQYETRWIVEAHLQSNQTVSVPQQYADAVTVTPISVNVSFPPTP